MTPELLARIGSTLYGASWMADLAAALKVNVRTIDRWTTGYSQMPPGIAHELRTICESRVDLLAVVRADLDIAIARQAS